MKPYYVVWRQSVDSVNILTMWYKVLYTYKHIRVTNKVYIRAWSIAWLLSLDYFRDQLKLDQLLFANQTLQSRERAQSFLHVVKITMFNFFFLSFWRHTFSKQCNKSNSNVINVTPLYSITVALQYSIYAYGWIFHFNWIGLFQSLS